jgi:DNA-binding transcriptional LysR family regulator
MRGRVWIGALLPAGDLDVPGLLARFSRAHPGVEVGLREGIAADMLGFLAADELDAAFCVLAGEIPDDLAAERLSREEVVAGRARRRAAMARSARREANGSPGGPPSGRSGPGHAGAFGDGVIVNLGIIPAPEPA